MLLFISSACLSPGNGEMKNETNRIKSRQKNELPWQIPVTLNQVLAYHVFFFVFLCLPAFVNSFVREQMFLNVVFLRPRNQQRTKRKFSEHASSIGGDEQNLDIPERLESSQAPRANEPNCVAVAQYASSTCTTAAQGLQDRGKRMIFVSSKQCAVPGVSWHKRGAWQVSWREKNERKYKKICPGLHEDKPNILQS